jgi:hypothetical protein
MQNRVPKEKYIHCTNPDFFPVYKPFCLASKRSCKKFQTIKFLENFFSKKQKNKKKFESNRRTSSHNDGTDFYSSLNKCFGL